MVSLKQTNPEAKLPTKGSAGASGFDVHALHDFEVSGKPVLHKIGFQLADITPGFELQVRPRSGNALKLAVTVSNTPGTIDNDYRGDIGILLHTTDGSSVLFKKGDRIAQLVTAEVIETEYLCVSEVLSTGRGEGGFGSTGA
jgi:dUTP pyrophosphatase